MRYLTILILLAFTSCAQIERRGYAFELSGFEYLREEINDKNDVIEQMGSPSFINNINGQELWVYYSEDVKKFLFFKPTILNRKITTINFSIDNKISKISNYDLSNDKKITFVDHYTEVASQKKSWWSEIFSNIGQVKPN